MKLGKPHVWIAILSLIGVLCMAVVDTRRTSPGELSEVHGRIPELAGGDGCSACHGGWRTNMTEACLECHDGIGTQIEARLGLHGKLPDGDAARCAVCHSDHHGPGFGIVNLQSFVQAGFHGGRDGFEHDFVGFPMDGRHLELDCSECHANADVRVLDEGMHRFVGLDQDCASCHDDPHEGRMKLSCAQCHAQRAWDELGSRDHDRFLPLTGGHEASGCRDCHEQRTRWSLERIGGKARRAPARECADCHDDPHRAEFLENVAGLLATTAGLACGTCHEPDHTSFRERDIAVGAELHACSGFSLAVPHDRTACADCHAPSEAGVLDDFAARYPGRAADDCAQCHADPHGGQFEHEPYAAKGCIACHDTRHFAPHEFGARRHQRTAFALSGAHLDADCDACHRLPPGGGDAPGPRVFAGTPAACEACHEDAHLGFFDWLAQPAPPSRAEAAGRMGGRRAGRLARAGGPANRQEPALEVASAPPSDCDACHTTGAFATEPREAFDHGRWTGFPIEGAHAQGECEVCHVPAAERDELGRRFGFVDAHFGPIARADIGIGGSCAVCHEDPHRGAFDTPSQPVLVGGRVGCARCHVESSFREFRGGFDHLLWTGFELSGTHAEINCTACHVPRDRPDEFGRTWGEVVGSSCSDCHADPHQGQFRSAGRTDCYRCHNSTTFTDLRFDHDRNSRFPLDDAHEKVACSACHLPVTAESGSRVVRYRPLPMECIDCHGSNEGPSPTRRPRGKKR